MSSALLSKSDLSLLSRPTPSRYRNVYVAGKDADGCTRYVAKVKSGGRLRTLPGSRTTSPAEAAWCVLRWYVSTFGDAWREALAARKRKPWRVWRTRNGWCAAVWLYGRRVEVRRVFGPRGWHVCREWSLRGRLVYRRVRESDPPVVFATRADAVRGIRRFVEVLLNLRSMSAVWRAGAAPPGSY